jgi:hypothetical protein
MTWKTMAQIKLRKGKLDGSEVYNCEKCGLQHCADYSGRLKRMQGIFKFFKSRRERS